MANKSPISENHSGKISILMINREIDFRRRNYQKAQFSKLGLKVEFVEPVRIETPPDEGEDWYDTGWVRPLRIAEYSLTLSHIHLWKICIARNSPVVVLEDDVIVDPRFPEILDDIVATMEHIDYLHLEPGGKKKLQGDFDFKLADTFLGKQLYVSRGGSGAYVVSPKGAKALLEFSKKHLLISDSQIDNTPKINRYQLMPAPIVQMVVHPSNSIFPNELRGTTLGSGPKPRFRSILKNIGLFRRIPYEIRMFRMRYLTPGKEV